MSLRRSKATAAISIILKAPLCKGGSRRESGGGLTKGNNPSTTYGGPPSLAQGRRAIPPSRQAEAPPFTQRRLQTDEIPTATSSLWMTTLNIVATISYVIAKEQSDCGNLKQRDRRFPRLARKPLNDTTLNIVATISYVIALCTFCVSKVKRSGTRQSQKGARFPRSLCSLGMTTRQCPLNAYTALAVDLNKIWIIFWVAIFYTQITRYVSTKTPKIGSEKPT